MHRKTFAILAAVTLGVAAGPAPAQNVPELRLAKDLLLPCQEADNDPRDGFIAELECVGFIRGFVAALALTEDDAGFCFPEANRDDQIRRAYVRWVHKSFSKRGNMPVGPALLAALDETFACE